MPSILTGFEAKARAKDEEHRRKLEEEVQRRKAQEQDSSKGENVWFSRRIHDGHLYHWAIFTYGKKYELRLPSREKYKDMLPNGRLVGSVVPSFKYQANIVPWSLEDEMMQVRDASLTAEGKPHVQDYYVCQIGWTTLSERDVDAQCEAAISAFGIYVLGFNDCQSFLKRFVRMIIHQPEGCALDYHWFADNVETQYLKLQEIAPDENIRAYQLHLQMTLVGVIGGAAGGTVIVYEQQKPMEAVPQGGGSNNHSGGASGNAHSGAGSSGNNKTSNVGGFSAAQGGGSGGGNKTGSGGGDGGCDCSC
ncbi:hypothetical protein GLAREA_05714 [Glarea lozoyensis ATCC 20868]|uniref:Uncharacterized protein n=1 Tax=Glarea lozoyensis (strain ATCC 20868 / MF5171) TaxID=1116229 RepID=S3DWR0_GLAL2|nr:uncharacterized protein GLAREA_05714 [Glarea lozoyensis ATCC 20868]EPE36376.1 hypothetical protein GLAREA_05714 [Glarea lozoyensis ATCC 20868]